MKSKDENSEKKRPTEEGASLKRPLPRRKFWQLFIIFGAWLVKKDLAKLSLATRLVSWKVSVKPCESCYLILFLKTVIHFFIFFAAFKKTWVNNMTCRKRKFFLRMQDLVFHLAMGRAGNLKGRYWSQKLCPNKYTRH